MITWTCPLCGTRIPCSTPHHYPLRCSCGAVKPSEHEPHTIPKSKGLGDLIARALKRIGIKPCGGCKKRQRLLNRLVPFH